MWRGRWRVLALLIALVMPLMGCVRARGVCDDCRPAVDATAPRDVHIDRPTDDARADTTPPFDATTDLPSDLAAPRLTQTLSIVATEDDGEISADLLLYSGETWWGNLLHTGSWTTGTGAPTITYVFLRFRLQTTLPAGAKVHETRLKVFGRPLTAGSKWDPTKHELIVSADRVADATNVKDKAGYPGGAASVVQTTSVSWKGQVWTPGAWIESPSLAPLVQELVDTQGALKQGAHLQLWLRAPQVYPDDAEVPFDDFDTPSGHPAQLTISWAEAP